MLNWLKNINRQWIREWCLTIAEISDAFRIMPRTLVIGYGYLIWFVVQWYVTLVHPSGEQTTFVSIVTGLAAVLFGFYVNTGRKWDANPPCVESTEASTTKDQLLQKMSDTIDKLSTQVAEKTKQ